MLVCCTTVLWLSRHRRGRVKVLEDFASREAEHQHGGNPALVLALQLADGNQVENGGARELLPG